MINATETGNFDQLQEVLPSYYGIKEELAFEHGVVLRNSKIVIPQALQSRVVRLAHEGHQGIVKTKMLL